MKYNEGKWNNFMDSLERIIYGMCAIYGLVLVITHFAFHGGLIPYFFDTLTIGTLLLLLGIYPIARKRGLERLKKGKWRYF